MERERRRKKKKSSARFEEEVVRKIFGHSPESALIGQGFFIRSWREFRFATSLARKKERDAKDTLREQRERHIPAVVYR